VGVSSLLLSGFDRFAPFSLDSRERSRHYPYTPLIFPLFLMGGVVFSSSESLVGQSLLRTVFPASGTTFFRQGAVLFLMRYRRVSSSFLFLTRLQGLVFVLWP